MSDFFSNFDKNVAKLDAEHAKRQKEEAERLERVAAAEREFRRFEERAAKEVARAVKEVARRLRFANKKTRRFGGGLARGWQDSSGSLRITTDARIVENEGRTILQKKSIDAEDWALRNVMVARRGAPTGFGAAVPDPPYVLVFERGRLEMLDSLRKEVDNNREEALKLLADFLVQNLGY
jgi:hypothetical protein